MTQTLRFVAALLSLTATLPLTAAAATLDCRISGSGAAAFGERWTVTVADDGSAALDGQAMKPVRWKEENLLQVHGSYLLYRLADEVSGQRNLLVFDPANGHSRSTDGTLRAVAQYVCR